MIIFLAVSGGIVLGFIGGAWLYAAAQKWEEEESVRERYRQEWPGSEWK